MARRHGISEEAIYTLGKRFVAMQSDDVKRLRHQMVSGSARRIRVAFATGRGKVVEMASLLDHSFQRHSGRDLQ